MTQLVPTQSDVDLEDLTAPRTLPLEPYSELLIDLASRFSQAIFRDRAASAYPELQALAFWMRKSELQRLQQEFQELSTGETTLVPRGTVFHIPPGNVDTIFVYSWLLSLLAGNRNIIRLSERTSPQTDLLCSILRAKLQESEPAVRQNTMIVRYGHDDSITSSLSAHCDVRVIWGGDATVSKVRQIPIPPHARELTFADRSSLSAIDAARFMDLKGPEKTRLIEKFFNDVFWFDQMACSSPRLLVWVGEPVVCQRAELVFAAELVRHLELKQHAIGPAAWIDKFAFACRAILETPVTAYAGYNGLTTLDLPDLRLRMRDHCGHGLLFQVQINALTELIPYLGQRDQTLTYFGFEQAGLKEFVSLLAGRAIDRLVPVGQALQFSRYWDGYDLMQEFCRRVYIGR